MLVGANGSGKTTLLRLLAGKRLAKSNMIRMGGSDPFREGVSGLRYLGTEWTANPTTRNDVKVSELLSYMGGNNYPERRELLVKMLDVDEEWHMHAVSDGERRRVQLCMGLIVPFEVLLLDEVTVDLDVLARGDLLEFLRRETEQRNAIICYATHIFDGTLNDWPTHLLHLSLGRVVDIVECSKGQITTRNLYDLCVQWLKSDRDERGERGSENKSAAIESNMASEIETEYFRRTRAR